MLNTFLIKLLEKNHKRAMCGFFLVTLLKLVSSGKEPHVKLNLVCVCVYPLTGNPVLWKRGAKLIAS